MGDDQPPRDWKDTLNLPRTDFPMKGNLLALEPRMLARWEAEGTWKAMLAANADKPPFVFHDGPPYANGHIHAGTALNKVLKDIVVKAQNMAGQRCDYVPGWDCHGLPIERAVEKRLKDKKVDRRTLPREDFLALCRAYAQEFIGIQRTEFKRLGLFADWDTPYTTLAFAYEAQEIRELARVARRGLLYRKKKAVYWCITDQTALAEADIEYEDRTSPSITVAFRTEAAAPGLTGKHVRREALADAFPFLKGHPVDLAIWTTTPWTLPANLAIAVHPDLEYVFYDLGPRVVVAAKDLLPRLLGEIAPEQMEVRTLRAQGAELSAAALVEPQRILGYASGRELEGFAYRHPFAGRQGTVVLGEHVTLEQGTGLVHTAPGHGAEDYAIGQAYGLEPYNPVLADGRFDDTVRPAELKGTRVFDANPRIVQLLVELGVLLNRPGETITHAYPHCDRCKNPVIFRATPQWFVALDRPMDGGELSLRAEALREIDRAVEWIPDWGKQRIRGMLENRPDWTLSRQRTWGVPLPVALCAACGEGLVSPEVMDRTADAVALEGAGAWYRKPLEEFLPSPPPCPACGKTEWTKGTDILDVWFDSACSFAAVMEPRHGPGPVDLYLEGSDQHRGWFHSSLLVSVATRDRAPYRRVLTHGFVVDGEGHKMSKSVGNVVAPEKMIAQYGAEVVRLWVASSDYRDDIRLSDGILKSLAEGYRKIRNTLRYALSNLTDFDPVRDAVSAADLLPLDAWAQGRLDELVARVRRAYQAYEFHLVFHAVVDFCGNDLSALYFDISKDRLYTWKSDGKPRRSGQTVLHRVVRDLLRLLAPVMSFTAEEAWAYLPGKRPPSVFLAGFPEPTGGMPPELGERFERLFAVRSLVQKQLEVARRDKVIGASLEAKVVLHAAGGERELLARHLAELPGLFIVSQVELSDAPTDRLAVEIQPADGAKCPRCWTYAVEVAAGEPVCRKCQAALG